jgi:DNA-binding FadR family transcriptional regulator
MSERTLTERLDGLAGWQMHADDRATIDEAIAELDGAAVELNLRDMRISELESTNARLVGALAEVRQALESSAARLRCEADDEESIGHMNTADDIRAIADTFTRVARIAKKALAHAGGEKPAS